MRVGQPTRRVSGTALSLCLLLSGALAACAGDEPSAEEIAKSATIELKPFPITGQPIELTDKIWTWVDFPDTKCRDGSPAGIALSKNSASKKVMFYFEGGGACFDALTCLISPGNTNLELFREEKRAGVFNRAMAQNPVGDWNFVYVPYCTGDTHGGTRSDVVIEGVQGLNHFVGYLNVQKFLQRVVPTFHDATDVLITGISAGGFGAAQNAVSIARAFPGAHLSVIDDSGPGFSTAVVPECLQRKWRETWGLDASFLADCGKACPNPDDFTQDYALAMTRTFQDWPSGLIESTRDSVISGFFGAGLQDCTATPLLSSVPGDIFEADLLAYREKARQYPMFGTYFPSGTKHTWLADDDMYTASTGGITLVDWIGKIVTGQAPGHAGP